MDKGEDPEGHQDQEQADPELSIAENQEICEAQVLAISGRAGAGASSIPKCPACGKGRHSREDCWVLHAQTAPEWLQDKLEFKKIGKGGQAKPPAQGGGKGKGPHKGGKLALQRLREHTASAGGLLDAQSGVAGEGQGRGAAR